MKTHHDLDVWKKSIDLVTKVYSLTKSFPKEELYGITNQIRRAIVSVPSNIAEGAARNTPKEFNNFLSIALGSLSEVETQLIISKNLKYINQENLDLHLNDLIVIRKMIIGLKKSLKL
ncbi:MAG: four helix bundle protein [Bacteroidales bacterium]|nr:four helix bundle protein [Bacteroidales bacterium]